MVKNFPKLGIQIPDTLLPKDSINPQKWAVIACDQYTSEPEYWHAVETLVGDAPSTLHIIFFSCSSNQLHPDLTTSDFLLLHCNFFVCINAQLLLRYVYTGLLC